MQPGTIPYNFGAHAEERTRDYMLTLDRLTPEQGADTLVWLATAEEPGRSSGGYFHERKPRTPNPLVDDDAAVDRLWAESERLIATAKI
jgi:hypothetical protein